MRRAKGIYSHLLRRSLRRLMPGNSNALQQQLLQHNKTGNRTCLPTTMPNHLTNSAFVRTSLTICDVFILGLPYLDATHMMSPEQLFESASPWFLDAESVWWRKFVSGLQ